MERGLKLFLIWRLVESAFWAQKIINSLQIKRLTNQWHSPEMKTFNLCEDHYVVINLQKKICSVKHIVPDYNHPWIRFFRVALIISEEPSVSDDTTHFVSQWHLNSNILQSQSIVFADFHIARTNTPLILETLAKSKEKKTSTMKKIYNAVKINLKKMC